MTEWTSAEIAELVGALASLAPASDQPEAIARIRALEEVKAACAAAQARESARLYELREQAEAGSGVPAGQRCKGLGSEIALARRESPSRGSRYLGLARALVEELPHTMAAMERGELSEWRATVVARETAWLSVEDRQAVDQAMSPRLSRLSDKRLAAETRALAQKLDAEGAVANLRRKEGERCVTLRPAPDSMAYLTALLPMREAVAAYATLVRDAQSAIASGQAGVPGGGEGPDRAVRTHAQIMADLLVQRLTGAASTRELPIELSLVMTDAALFGKDETPAHLPGHGPVPAALARWWLAPESTESVFLRRLFTRPGTGELVAMDSRRRVFDGQLRKMILLRDDVCRTPYCGAPIRHVDHGTPVRELGETSYENGSGLCRTCNFVKDGQNWTYTAGGSSLTVSTPTGLVEEAPPPVILSGIALEPRRREPREPGVLRRAAGEPRALQREPREYARRATGVKPALRSTWCQFQAGPERESRRLAEALLRRGMALPDSGGGTRRTRDRGTRDTHKDDEPGAGDEPGA